MTDPRHTVVFQPSGKRAEVTPDKTILHASRLCGVFIPSVCGGRGKCGKCRVRILDPDTVQPPTEAEEEILQGQPPGLRLACMTYPRDDVVVEIPPESRDSAPDILVEGLDYEITVDPIVTKHHLKVRPPTLEDPLADFERVRKALERKGMVIEKEAWEVLQSGPGLMREADWDLTLSLWNSTKLIRIEKGNATGRSLGAAIDVGTTTMVCYLVDLRKGKTLAWESSLNPQIPYGEDVVTRLAFSNLSGDNARLLHNLVMDEASQLVDKCCRKIKARTEEVLDLCLVGNTVMHHIAVGLPTEFLGFSPFSPVVRKGLDTDAGTIGMKIHPDTPVHALPTLAGYVGADTCGVILSSRIHEAEDTSMAIDIGTNGEIVLGDRRGLTVCSCAAGPALEGAHIRFGMRAAEGAIQRVTIADGRVRVKTIGGKPPIGLAGAGIIDAIAEMRKCGAIGHDGRLGNHPCVRKAGRMKEFVLVEKEKAGLDSDIVITQRDIREIQLAKAAIFTGAYTLMEEKGISPDDVSAFYVAGAFGNYIDFSKAKIIGLIPDIPMEHLRFIGNGAAAGAKLALLSRSLREVAEHIADRVKYVELTCSADFTSNYMDASYLPHKDPSLFPSVKL
jgi:uncharacterized 2Fe-2S/4Fe-4S cluster protein (DUF4445 family)